MNGTVERMLDLTTARDTEIAFLEGLLEEDCKCESLHDIRDCEVCSGDVVARKTACGGADFLICTNSYRWNSRVIASGIGRCRECHNPVEECWTITLI